MKGYTDWEDIRARLVERHGGEEALNERVGKLRAETQGFRLAEARRARSLTQQEVADRMGVTKGRISQIERGSISGQDVLARYIEALGGHLQQAAFFDDGVVLRVA